MPRPAHDAAAGGAFSRYFRAGTAARGNGELHQGTFVDTCASAADPACGTPKLPSGIAVGADFHLRFDPSTPATGSLEPNASFFSAAGAGRFQALRAGYGVVLHNVDSASVRGVNDTRRAGSGPPRPSRLASDGGSGRMIRCRT